MESAEMKALMTTLDALTVRVLLCDHEGRALAGNAAWRRPGLIAGCTFDAIPTGASYVETLVARAAVAGVASDVATALRGLMDGTREQIDLELMCGTHWHRVRARRGALGLVVQHDDADPTRARTLEERLYRADAALALGRAYVQLGSWTFSPHLGTAVWSPEVLRMFHRAPGTTAPAIDELFAMIHAGDRELVASVYLEAMTGGRAMRFDFRTSPDLGPVRQLRATFHARGEPPKRHLVGAVVDLSEPIVAEEVRRGGLRRQARLWERMLQAQDEERRHLARELHDQAGSSLAALLVACKLLESANDLADVKQRAGRIASALSDVVGELARLARGLHPIALEDLGLGPALARVADGLRGRGLEIELDVALGATRLPDELELALYRVAQEALSNVVKHAGANRVWLLCRREGERVRLCVRDDGAGFSPGPGEGEGPGLGLPGMRDRMALVGGTLEVSSTPGQGTTIDVIAPIIT